MGLKTSETAVLCVPNRATTRFLDRPENRALHRLDGLYFTGERRLFSVSPSDA